MYKLRSGNKQTYTNPIINTILCVTLFSLLPFIFIVTMTGVLLRDDCSFPNVQYQKMECILRTIKHLKYIIHRFWKVFGSGWTTGKLELSLKIEGTCILDKDRSQPSNPSQICGKSSTISRSKALPNTSGNLNYNHYSYRTLLLIYTSRISKRTPNRMHVFYCRKGEVNVFIFLYQVNPCFKTFWNKTKEFLKMLHYKYYTFRKMLFTFVAQYVTAWPWPMLPTKLLMFIILPSVNRK